MKNTFYETNLSTGLEFETEMVQITSEYYRGFYKTMNVSKDSFRASTEEEDRFKGVDFYADGVPVDVTLIIDYKDNCEFDPKTYFFGGQEVKFGFRTGNIHSVVDERGRRRRQFHKFDEPVLVIGVSYVVRDYLMNVIEDLRKEIGNLLETAIEFYYKKIDLLEEAV